MRSVLPILTLAAALPMLLGQILYIQTPSLVEEGRTWETPSDRREAVKVDVNLVLVPVTVTDRSGQTVVGLTAEHFQLLEDGSPQSITHFNAEDAPSSIGVLFDVSRSMERKLSKALSAMRTFLDNLNPSDEAFLMTFSDRPELIMPFTTNFDQIQNSLIFTAPAGKTALIDTVYVALQQLRSARNPRKALLIVSDGGENHSRYSEKEFIRTALEADTQIYTIGIHDSPRSREEKRGPRLLQRLARMTGGQYYDVRNLKKLDDIARNLALAMHNQYVLGYRPPPNTLPGKWRRIRVRLKEVEGKDLRVYARSGYYAPR